MPWRVVVTRPADGASARRQAPHSNTRVLEYLHLQGHTTHPPSRQHPRGRSCLVLPSTTSCRDASCRTVSCCTSWCCVWQLQPRPLAHESTSARARAVYKTRTLTYFAYLCLSWRCALWAFGLHTRAVSLPRCQLAAPALCWCGCLSTSTSCAAGACRTVGAAACVVASLGANLAAGGSSCKREPLQRHEGASSTRQHQIFVAVQVQLRTWAGRSTDIGEGARRPRKFLEVL